MKNLDVKFKRQAKTVDRKLARAQGASILLLALTSTFILYNLTNQFFSQYITNTYFKILICSICIWALLEAIDLGLKTFLPYVSVEILSGEYKKSNRSRKFFVFGLAFICLVQLIATSALTFMSADDITNYTLDKPDFSEIQNVSSERSGQFELSLAELKETIQDAKKTESTRIANAKKEGAAIMHTAINSKGSRMAELYRQGNRWAEKQLRPTLAKARKDSARLVQNQIGLVAQLNNQKLTFIDSQTANDAAILQPLAEWQKSEIQQYQATKQSRNSLIKYAAILFAFGFLFFTFLRANYQVATLENPQPENEERSFMQITTQGMKKAYQKGLERLDKMIATPLNLAFATPESEAIQIPQNQTDTVPRSKPKQKKRVQRTKREKYDVAMYAQAPEIEQRGDLFYLVLRLADGGSKYMDKRQVQAKVRDIKRRIGEIEPLVRLDPDNSEKKYTLDNRRKKLAFFNKAVTAIVQAEFNA